MQPETIVNRVAESGVLSINLEDYYPKELIAVFDLKNHLFKELILKEKEFRAALLEIDWSSYQNKYLAVTCSSDAIVPMWAYMLVAMYAQPYAKDVLFGDEKSVLSTLIIQNISSIDIAKEYTDQRVVIKGCGDKPIPEAAYVKMTTLLRPIAKSIIYGEICSNVPIYKSKKVNGQ